MNLAVPFKPRHSNAAMMESKDQFVKTFGGVFEHSPWVAARAYGAVSAAGGVHAAMVAAFRAASREERLGVLRAHPDLAGRLALAKRLTADSEAEQASAGLDCLTDDERMRFTELNGRYVAAFGFPFIIAVRGLSKSDILAAFEQRIGNSAEAEFETACAQVEKIAKLRLEAMGA